MKQEKMNDNILAPLATMRSAEPASELFDKIQASIFTATIIPMQKIKWIAASILVLVAANVYALKQQSGDSENSYSETIITDFSIYDYED